MSNQEASNFENFAVLHAPFSLLMLTVTSTSLAL